MDVDGDGIQELVFAGYSGGAHCCNTNYVIKLSDHVSVMLELNTQSSSVKLVDLNRDGVFEAETLDYVFHYWNTGFSGSPSPRIVLSIQSGTYNPNIGFMIRPAPSDKVIRDTAATIKGWNSAFTPVAWKYVADLVYSGNLASAQKYVDLAWREGDDSLDGNPFGSKDRFWSEFFSQLEKSHYYPHLLPVIRDSNEGLR
jgi:hypothetical protein